MLDVYPSCQWLVLEPDKTQNVKYWFLKPVRSQPPYSHFFSFGFVPYRSSCPLFMAYSCFFFNQTKRCICHNKNGVLLPLSIRSKINNRKQTLISETMLSFLQSFFYFSFYGRCLDELHVQVSLIRELSVKNTVQQILSFSRTFSWYLSFSTRITLKQLLLKNSKIQSKLPSNSPYIHIPIFPHSWSVNTC